MVRGRKRNFVPKEWIVPLGRKIRRLQEPPLRHEPQEPPLGHEPQDNVEVQHRQNQDRRQENEIRGDNVQLNDDITRPQV